jgi:hypothetical protein
MATATIVAQTALDGYGNRLVPWMSPTRDGIDAMPDHYSKVVRRTFRAAELPADCTPALEQEARELISGTIDSCVLCGRNHADGNGTSGFSCDGA